MAKPPAFQLYVKDAYTGCAEMSGEEFGAYMRGLCWSWDNGPLPLDPARRARVLMVDRADFDRLWEVIGPNWQETTQGFTNARLEKQRQELAEFKEEQSKRGKRGADARWHSDGNAPANGDGNATAMPEAIAEAPDKQWPDDGSSSAVSDLHSSLPSAVSTRTLRASARQQYGPPAMGGPLEHRSHGWCNDRGLCLPAGLYAELLARLPSHRKEEFRPWLVSVVDGLGDETPGDNVYDFWRNHFGAWVGTITTKPSTVKETAGVRLARVGAEYLKGEGISARPLTPTRPQRQIVGGE